MKRKNKKPAVSKNSLPKKAVLRKMTTKDVEKLFEMAMEELRKRRGRWTKEQIITLVKNQIDDPAKREHILKSLENENFLKVCQSFQTAADLIIALQVTAVGQF